MILDGRRIAAELCAEIGQKVREIEGKKPCLAFLLIGENSASQIYVRAKQKACAAQGIESQLYALPEALSQQDLLAQIATLNRDAHVDGILVQLPLPPQIEERAVMSAIDPTKDVDGFHPLNVGKMLLGEEGGFYPCTPYGIKVLLERAHIPIEGKRVVIVGRSNLVGKPLAAILVQKKPYCNATVTIAHSQSENLREITRSAEILVVAIGQPHFIRKEMVSPGATVIDVGIHRTKEGTIIGDVHFEEVAPLTSHITPVPGGVGPMTIAILLQNTLLSYVRQRMI